jgi:hypothetical protein
MGVLTSGLKPRFDFIYEDLLCFHHENCEAKKDGRWGIIRFGDVEAVPI